MEGQFLGKKVIVTGGSRGIGRETVKAFCKQGAKVVFLWNSSEKAAVSLENETGAKGVQSDVGDSKSLITGIREAVSYLSGVDILVNNAGIAKSGLLQDLSLEDWNRIVAVDLTAIYIGCKEVIPFMVSQKQGRIINISSMWGQVGASCEAAYSAVKAGVIGLTKALAKELGPSGITVNAVAPGVIETDMMSEYGSDVKAELAEETPLCRLGTPSDVSASILFLAGEGGNFMTGQVIAPNGGFVI